METRFRARGFSYIQTIVKTDWDEKKRAANLAKHDLDFAGVLSLEWATVTVEADTRFDYGEVRLRAPGVIGSVVYMVVFTIERQALRVISFRRRAGAK